MLASALFFSFSPMSAGGFEAEDEEPLITDTIRTPCVRIDKSAINVRMAQLDSQIVRTIQVDNRGSRKSVDYRMSIRFIRSLADAEGMSAQDGAYAGLLNPSETEADTVIRTMQYEHVGYLSFAYGLQDKYRPLSLATRFKADSSGFNATSVDVWFIGDYMSEGVIQVEVRAGGSSIDDAVPLATGALLFSIPEGLENGRMYSIPLARPAAIYPYEDFYVIVTYPSGQTRPQGCARNQDIKSVSGRYLLKSGDQWVDLQKMQDFSNCGWLLNVGEAIDDSTAWLVPIDSAIRTIAADTAQKISLVFRNTPQLRGVCRAEVTLLVRDTCLTQVVIPVTLHLNEAPYFLNAPKKVIIPENTVQTFEIEIFDSDNTSFTLEPVIGAKVASYRLSGRILTLTVAPLKGDAGNYNIKFRVTDTQDGSRDLDIPIYVTVLEQLVEPSGLVLSFMGGSETYTISDLFRYVNEGGLSIIVTVRDEKIIRIERPDLETIVLIPDELGSTYLDFSFMDDEGNVHTFTFPVTVGQCEDPARIIVQKWDNILLVNNAAGFYSNEGYQWYKNKQPIPRATAQYYSAGNKAGDLLDFTAAYYVRLVTITGDTVYSCPQTPVRQSTSTFSVYPNPVSNGDLLTIETGYETGDHAETLVQLYDFNGRIVQTGRFKGAAGTIRIDRLNSGSYMLQVSSSNKTTTTGIIVK